MRYAAALECQTPRVPVAPAPTLHHPERNRRPAIPPAISICQQDPLRPSHTNPACRSRSRASQAADFRRHRRLRQHRRGQAHRRGLIDAQNKLFDIVGGHSPRAGQRGVTVDRGYDQALVRDIQTELAARGHYTSRVDGLFGRGTRGAIIDYQTAQGLPITGEPTPELLQQLRNGQ